jgi:dihydrofolate reductase
MVISLIVAVAANRVIGRDNKLPWRLPNDLRRFRALTMGKPLVMGRKTYESIGRPLDGRHNIVVSRNPDYRAEGCTVVHSPEAALAAAAGAAELFVIGGAELYAQFLPQAHRLYLTLVHAHVAGDTYFPPIVESQWREIEREEHQADGRHAYAYSLLVLERSGNQTGGAPA